MLHRSPAPEAGGCLGCGSVTLGSDVKTVVAAIFVNAGANVGKHC